MKGKLFWIIMAGILLCRTGFADSGQNSSQNTSRTQTLQELIKDAPVNLPPPPPPPPRTVPTKVYKKVVKVNKMSPQRLEKMMEQKDLQQSILWEQNFLEYGGSRTLYLRHTNTFAYTPSLPVLFVLPKQIDNVILYTQGAKAMIDRNLLIFIPPSLDEGKLIGFVVLFKDHTAVEFVGERVSADDKHKDKITTYYRYVLPQHIPVDAVITAFLKHYQRCPLNGETITVNGNLYKFVKMPHRFFDRHNEFYCNGYMKILQLTGEH